MSTPSFDDVGRKVGDIELLDLFPSEEGSIDQIYGRIGNGKTYAATADILRDLERGLVVYANWEIDFNGFDQRESLPWIILGLFGFKRRFYRFRKENLHKIGIDEDFIDKFSQLTDCKIYLDEGHVIFDSYQMAKISMKKRNAVLHTRHFNRSIVIVSQRPTAVHVSARANVNRFYKCERLLRWPFLIFRKTEFQDMTNETVDETKVVSRRVYLARKKILRAYNTKYLRGGIPKSQEVHFDAYDISFRDSLRLLIRYFSASFAPLKRREAVISPLPIERETVHKSPTLFDS